MKRIPDYFINKWQGFLDILADLLELPSALLMKNTDTYMEVFLSSSSLKNPYIVGEKELWYGLYCEKVIKSQKELLIPNALKDKFWENNPDIKLGMISYLGYPINYPDKTPFGTICVLDLKERNYSKIQRKLLQNFKKIIEADLAHIVEEKNLSIENKKLLAAVQQSANTIVITDIEGNIEYINPKFTEVTGYTIKDAVGQNPRFLNSGEQENDYYETMWSTISKGNVWHGEFCNKKKTGELFWENVTISPIKDELNNIINYLAIKEDITDKKNAENLAEISRKRLIQSKKLTKHGDWELDIKSGIFTFSDEFYEILHTNAEIEGGYEMSMERYANEFVHPEDRFLVKSEAKEAINSADPDFSKYIEGRILYKDGGVGYSGMRYNLVKDDNGNTIKTYGVNQDITERILYQQELIEARKKAEESDRLKTAFLANMSHEIRTPMNSILGFTELLLDPDLTYIEMESYKNVIHRGVNRLLNTVNAIVEISKIEADSVDIIEKDTDIISVVDEQVRFYRLSAEEKGLKLIFDSEKPYSCRHLFTDSNKLESIISNLLNNAIKYTNGGEVKVLIKKTDTEFVFCIEDTGIGIPKDKQEIIFKRFRQADITDSSLYEGSGLGLAISKSYVEMLGGEIGVESTENIGSKFFFTIPIKN